MAHFVAGLADTKASLSRCIRIYGTLVFWLLGLNITKKHVKREEVNGIKIPPGVPKQDINFDASAISTSALTAHVHSISTKIFGSYEMTETSKSYVLNAMTSGKAKSIHVNVSYDVTVFMSEEEWNTMTDGERLEYLQDVPMNAYTLSYDVG